MHREFRFGINLSVAQARAQWQDAARQVEDLGYDVLLVPDHLGMPAPIPALMSAAEATTSVRLGTLVLNAAFYQPALLARDVAALHELTDGRFELGLGAGYEGAQDAAAGASFASARERVEHLRHLVTEVRGALTEKGHEVPIMVAGVGDRLLGLAARHADIVNIAGTRSAASAGQPDPLRQRIEVIRSAAGDRFAALELSLLVTTVHIGTNGPDLDLQRQFNPHLSDDELLALPGVLYGSEQDIADTLRRYRETYGISYITTVDHGDNREALGRVISLLR